MLRSSLAALAAVLLCASMAAAQPTIPPPPVSAPPVGVPRPAAQDAPRIVSFENLTEMLAQKVPEDQIRAMLADSPTRFTLSPAQVEQLKQAGASEGLLTALTTAAPLPANAPIGSYVLILDCSNSMRELVENGQTKFDFARKAALDLVEAIPAGKELGMIVYGYDNTLACRAVATLRPMGPIDAAGKVELVKLINRLAPAGHTPIANSLKVASRHLAKATSAAKIILITDGMETCHGKPDEEAANLVQAFPQLRGGVNVIGFGLKPEEVKAVGAIASGRGRFYDARAPQDLIKAVKEVEQTLARPEPALALAPEIEDAEPVKIVESPALAVVEIPTTPASKVKPSFKVGAPAALELGHYAAARIDDSRKTGKYHYWLVDVPAGSYKIVIDYRRADDNVNANLQAEFNWMNSDGTVGDRLGDINQIDVRGREFLRFQTDKPMQRVLRFENWNTIADYHIGVFPEETQVTGPFFFKPPKIYQMELGKPVQFTWQPKGPVLARDGFYAITLPAGDFRVSVTGYGPANQFRHVRIDTRTLEGERINSMLIDESTAVDQPSFGDQAKLSLAEEQQIVFRIHPDGEVTHVKLMVEPITEE